MSAKAFDLYGSTTVAVPDVAETAYTRTNAGQDAVPFVVQDIADEMAAFDRLPRKYQLWLDQGKRKYSAVQIDQMLRRGQRVSTDDDDEDEDEW